MNGIEFSILKNCDACDEWIKKQNKIYIRGGTGCKSDVLVWIEDEKGHGKYIPVVCDVCGRGK